MEEKIYEMEYIINGEKYIVICTKVEDELVETTSTNDEVEINVDPELMDDAIPFSVEDIPEGIDVATWLSIIDNYGIILTK